MSGFPCKRPRTSQLTYLHGYNVCRWQHVRHTELQGILRAALHAVSEEFLSEASQTNDQSGSTAVAALRVRHLYVVGHVGDSRALLCRRNTTTPGNGTTTSGTPLCITACPYPPRPQEHFIHVSA